MFQRRRECKPNYAYIASTQYFNVKLPIACTSCFIFSRITESLKHILLIISTKNLNSDHLGVTNTQGPLLARWNVAM